MCKGKEHAHDSSCMIEDFIGCCPVSSIVLCHETVPHVYKYGLRGACLSACTYANRCNSSILLLFLPLSNNFHKLELLDIIRENKTCNILPLTPLQVLQQSRPNLLSNVCSSWKEILMLVKHVCM